MFLGGAEHDASHIRGTSVKSALAFWWRAYHYAKFVSDADGNLEVALKEMQKDEQALFGGPKGQGIFLLKINHSQLKLFDKNTVLKDERQLEVGVGARYLGYGLMEAFRSVKKNTKAGQLTRNAIQHKQCFTIQLLFRPNAKKEQISEIMQALKIFGLVGGLGSRVRRGWGAVTLRGLKCNNIEQENESFSMPQTIDEYISVLKELIEKSECMRCSGSDFKLTAFARETRVDISTKTGEVDALTVLDDIGSGFLKYRGFGQKGYVGCVTVDQSFQNDHDWYRKVGRFSGSKGGRGNYIPCRTAFGLPHNYDSKEFGVTALGDLDRRASPLMFHIHKIGGSFFAVALFFPNLFLDTNTVAVWEGKNKTKTSISYAFSPEVISNFLDGIKHNDDPSVQENASFPYFPSVSIFP